MTNLAHFFGVCLLLLVPYLSKSQHLKLPPLYEGLGEYQIRINSDSEDANKYFCQGLILMYGYNYPEATRSFRAAAKCDPNSGICRWAEAVSLGECIENPGDQWCIEAYKAQQRANQLKGRASTKEQELIATITDRFEKKQTEYEVHDMRFVEKMKKLHDKYPDDPDITAIYANSHMQRIRMADGMVGKKPTGATKDIVDALEKGLEKYPYHPGLNHFYIHAMEGCNLGKKALAAAERLEDLVPSSGHLQHMPAHIYFRYGRYHDASNANQKGIDADSYVFNNGGIKEQAYADFYLHNHYYLFHSLMMEGRSKDAIKAAFKVISRLKSNDLPSNTYLQNLFYSVPYMLMARFSLWDQIDKEPMPDKDHSFTKGAWFYARGLSKVSRGDIQGAKKDLSELKNAKASYENSGGKKSFKKKLLNILEMSSLDLSGRIEAFHGNYQKQIENLKEALKLEESMYIKMLPWYMPLKQSLGYAYLKAGNPKEAEIFFIKDLQEHPKNGWALYGLMQSLMMQSRSDEIVDKEDDFKETWKYADIDLDHVVN